MDTRPSNPASLPETKAEQRRDALTRLTPFGWSGGLVFIVATLTASFFLFGYFSIYWRTADMDFMVVYNALVMNDGKPQWFFDHTGYFTILAVKTWFQFLHSLGLLEAYSLPTIPPASDVAGFDAAMTSAIRAGRIAAWLIATGFILIFAALMRTIVRDWRIALLATFAFAFSGGVAMHLRILRTEMIAACLGIFALMILIAAARRGFAARPLALGLAALLCMLGLDNKVQLILLIAAFPVLALAFGSTRSASTDFWKNTGMSWLVVAVSGGVALLLTTKALPLITTGLGMASALGLRPLIAGTFGLYQAALVLFILGCVIAFSMIWKVSASETLAAIFAMIAGAALGLLALNIEYNVNNVVAVINPIEKMLSFAGLPEAGGGISSAIHMLLSNIGGVLMRYTYVLRTSPRPSVFLIWVIIPGIIYAWRKGERQTALQAALLMLAAFGIDTIGNQRGLGLQVAYFVFTDPLIIIAGALLLDRMAEVKVMRWSYPIGMALVVLHIGFSQGEPVKRAMSRSGPEIVCTWNVEHMPLLPVPWCKERTPASTL
ncbi:MAG: hypothetical protein J0G95_07135 [Rhizobiales bacterium]|nr:hypothetical protein [Hyphomicrobiales bacterium]